MAVEDDHRDLTVTQHTQLVSLLHQPELPLGEGHLPVPLVRDALDGNLLASHGKSLFIFKKYQ